LPGLLDRAGKRPSGGGRTLDQGQRLLVAALIAERLRMGVFLRAFPEKRLRPTGSR